MANNRLYILDTETGDKLFIGKGFGSGWCWNPGANDMTKWLCNHDIDSSRGDGLSRLRFVTEMDPPDAA